jgi:hypothetical protein
VDSAAVVAFPASGASDSSSTIAATAASGSIAERRFNEPRMANEWRGCLNPSLTDANKGAPCGPPLGKDGNSTLATQHAHT